MICAVLVPQGKIALGKLAQALVHGARLLQVDGNFDDCLELARKLAVDYPVALVNSVNPYRIEGQKTAAFEICDALGRRPRRALPPGRQRRQHHRVLEGLQRVRRATASSASTPRMFGFQAAGAAPIVNGAPVLQPDDHRDRDPDRQPGVVDVRPRRPRRVRRPDRRGHRQQILAAYRLRRPQRGRLRRAGVGGQRRRAA